MQMQLHHPLAVVTPTLDGHLLEALARVDAWFTTSQLRHTAPSFSSEGIRRALRRLVEQGIVSVEVVGRTSQYRLNRDHLAAPSVIAMSELDSELIRRLGRAVSAWEVPPTYASLFGSAARSAMRPDSDIDLFVVYPDHADLDTWGEQTLHLARQVTLWTGNDARILDMAESEVTARRSEEPVLQDIAAARHGQFAGAPRWLATALG
jgi:predicted nucleotidyltransferase